MLALALLLLAGASVQASTVLGPWVPLFDGIDHAVGTNTPGGGSTMPDLMVIYALRIDLTDTNLQFYTAPRIKTGYSAGDEETAGYTTSNFLTMHALQVAVNANYFHDPGTSDTESPDYLAPAGTPYDVIGLEICQGQVVSPQISGDYTASLMFDTNNQVTFFPTNWPANPTTGIYTAVTGPYAILVSNVNLGSNYLGSSGEINGVNPRTAFGLTQDRHYLYILVIDGRQPGYSEGALDWETAVWLQLLGATDGANMDGGGSSCMVIQSSTGSPVELNRDSASASDGRERTVGSQFGIYAKPVSGFINNVTALPDDTAATITWTTIDGATTQVQYGLTTNFTESSSLYTALVTNHAALLTGLTPDTGYYFAAYSKIGSTLYASSNFFFITSNYVTTDSLVELTNNWEYTTNDLDGVNWTATNYDDSGWFGSGPGLLWADEGGPNSEIPLLDTEMPLSPGGPPYITYYFRTQFDYTNSLSEVTLLFTNYVDDGAVFYLNGAEIYRLRMPPAPTVIDNSTLATNYPCDGAATCPDPFTLSGDATTNLVVGDNVLAVEVHLDNPQAEAITFGSSLVSTVPVANPPQLGIAVGIQSGTISWSRGGFILQQAGSLNGPWSNVPGPVLSSPYIWTNSRSSQYFRLSR
jgi:exopolysaccharide biosynthesis protein